jgi:hypothetical protein
VVLLYVFLGIIVTAFRPTPLLLLVGRSGIGKTVA